MSNMKKSLILNILIIIFVIVSCTFMYFGIKFMDEEVLLESSKTNIFRFFTVDSNILVAISSIILVYFEIKVLKRKKTTIPNWVYIIKMISTSAITLTFLTTLLFLAPLYGFMPMYRNNNLFLHLIVPLLTLISYIFLEKHQNKYKYAPLGMIPMILYSIYYVGNILIHLDISNMYLYDFYGFLQGDINNIYIVIPIIYIVCYLISLGLIHLNKTIETIH